MAKKEGTFQKAEFHEQTSPKGENLSGEVQGGKKDKKT
jgi:hypothetical protein